MNIKIKTTLAVLILLFTQTLIAQENEVRNLGEFVVSANRLETPVKKSGKVVYKITSEDIKRQPSKTVAELLNDLPGLHIGGVYNTPGTNLAYNIRGGRNGDILILIDEVPISDPSSISNDYDLRLLTSSMVESIEVLKGASSTMYGSGASAGVINIKLKRSAATRPEINLTQTLGSFKTSNTSADIQGRSAKFGYLASASYQTSEGISAAESLDPNIEFGNDGMSSLAARVKLDYDAKESLNYSLNMSYNQFKSDYDDGAFLDADNEFDINQFNSTFNVKTRGNSFNSSHNLSYNRIDREFKSRYPSESLGEAIYLTTDNSKVLSDKLKLTAGGYFQSFFYDTGEGKENVYNASIYKGAEYQVVSGLTLNGAIRLEGYNKLSDWKLVYHFNPVYNISLGNDNELKLFGSYGTALITPTLYQSSSPNYGNENLEAQESSSFEFGTSLYLGNHLSLNVEYFNRKETNAIGFVSLFDDQNNWIGGIYENIDGERKIDGFEMDMTYAITNTFSVTAHGAFYSFGDPTQFYRIPDTKYGATLQYAMGSKTNFSLRYTHFGERIEPIFTDPFQLTLDSFNMVDLSIAHELKEDKIFLTLDVNNLLDEDFVATHGFATRPINFAVGFNVKF